MAQARALFGGLEASQWPATIIPEFQQLHPDSQTFVTPDGHGIVRNAWDENNCELWDSFQDMVDYLTFEDVVPSNPLNVGYENTLAQMLANKRRAWDEGVTALTPKELDILRRLDAVKYDSGFLDAWSALAYVAISTCPESCYVFWSLVDAAQSYAAVRFHIGRYFEVCISMSVAAVLASAYTGRGRHGDQASLKGEVLMLALLPVCGS